MRVQASIESKNTHGRSFMPVTSGLVQRKCACGNHTVAGGECAACEKNKSGLQRKLGIGASNDPLELEADRIADQVMETPANSTVSSAPLRIQRFSGQANGDSVSAPASVDRVLSSSGRPLEPTLRQDMEQRFGHDFSRVRVHSGVAAEQSAREVNANAYTVGHNIVFGQGQFAPKSMTGKRLLAHELAHTIQQQVTSFRGAENVTLRRQLYSGPNVGPPVSELPRPPMLSCGIDKEGDWVCKGENLPGIDSTPEIPLDPRRIPDKIREALGPNSSTRTGLAECRAFPGFTAGGSSEFEGQCCKGNESMKTCCPPNRISFKAPFPRCCNANEDLKNGICVKKMESGEPELTLPPLESLPMQDGLERTLPEGEEYA